MEIIGLITILIVIGIMVGLHKANNREIDEANKKHNKDYR